MHEPTANAGQASGLPLTHAAYIAACGGMPPRPWVQVRKRHPDGPIVLCAKVAELVGGEGQWFKVDTGIGPLYAHGENLRLCSGDGRCACEATQGNTGRPC
jgi:hypothetical protein